MAGPVHVSVGLTLDKILRGAHAFTDDALEPKAANDYQVVVFCGAAHLDNEVFSDDFILAAAGAYIRHVNLLFSQHMPAGHEDNADIDLLGHEEEIAQATDRLSWNSWKELCYLCRVTKLPWESLLLKGPTG